MEHITFHPLNLRLEAAACLSRIAYRGENERSGDLKVAIDYYCKKYNLDRARFAPMLEAYEFVKARFVCEEQELLTLFGEPEGMESNISDLIRQLRFNLKGERIHDISSRITLFLSDEVDEPITRPCDVSDLIAYVQRQPVSDSAKLMLADAIIRFEEYESRANVLLDQAEALIREKQHLLEPYAEHALEVWRILPDEGAFFDTLALEGIRLDCPRADVYPMVIQFTMISVHSNAVSAQQFGEGERANITYGIYVDEFSRCARSGKTDLESIANLLRALDDKKRLQILVALRERPLYGQELASVTELSPGTVSHHMGELVGTGLVTIEKQGVKLLYSINEPRIRELTAMLEKNFLH